MQGRVARLARKALLLGSMVALTACYHTITTTSLQPGTKHVVAWAPAFIEGLVPANVDAGKMCGAKPVQAVDSQYSFLNLIVGAVTFSIFTPMQVTVTCAQ